MKSREKSHLLLSYGLLLPAFIVSVLLIVYPFLVTFNFSIRPGATMNTEVNKGLEISLSGYARALTNIRMWKSVGRSFIYTFGSLFPSYLIGLITAIILNQKIAGRRMGRILTIMPWTIPGVVASIIFLWMMDSSYGVMNFLMMKTGVIGEYKPWFFDPELVMFSVILPTIWKGYPFFTLTILASLQSIPQEQYEAAHVDGCGFFRKFIYVTWAGIKDSSIMALILNGLWSFRIFDIIYATTQGGPNKATTTIAVDIYNEAFKYFDISYASVLGMISFIICALIVLIFYPIMQRNSQ